MVLYRTAEQELEEQRVLIPELADQLSRGLNDSSSRSSQPPREE